MASPHLEDGSATADRPAYASHDGDPAHPGHPRRRRLLAIALLAMLVAAIAVVVIATVGSGSPDRAQAGTGIPAGERTTAVSRRTLTESTSVDGTLGYKGSYELYDRLAEAGTFTWLPSVGTVIRRGGTLFRENNLPVVLMYGRVPAYRTLARGVSNGPDVSELNRNLIDLGFDPDHEIGDRDHFGAATAAAVRRWQKAEGLPRTGRVELGRIIFAPSSQRVTKLNVTLGEDPPGASEPPAETTGEEPTEPAAGTTTEPGEETPAGTPTEPTSEAPAEEPSETSGESPPETESPTNTPPKSKTPAEHKSEESNPSSSEKGPSHHGKGATPGKGAPESPREGTKESSPERGEPTPAGRESSPGASSEPNGSSDGAKESAEGPDGSPSRSPSSGGPVHGGEGEGAGGAGMLVLDTTSAHQIVQVQLKADEQKLARVGESAPVTLPSGRVVRGRITEVGSVASEAGGAEGPSGGESESGGGEDATVPVTLALKHPVAHLDEAPVSVELVESVSRDVLTVPATALAATAGGGYAIEVLEHRRRVQLPVRPGMFADGYVQIEGAGVREGLTVLESE